MLENKKSKTSEMLLKKYFTFSYTMFYYSLVFWINVYLNLILIDRSWSYLVKRKFYSDEGEHGDLRINKTPKIINGFAIEVADSPSMVVFINLDSMCGGTILNSWTIVTAAHCLGPNKDVYYMTVRVGVTRVIEENAVDYEVLYHVAHPEYDVEEEFDCDIALLFIVGPVKLGPKVQRAIVIQDMEWMNSTFMPEFIVTGWGMIEQNGPTSENLMMTYLTLVPNDKCTEMHNGARITDTMFCLYGQGISDTCRGDSGGGVIWRDQLVGIVSHGAGCALPNKPSVYTSVYIFREWMQSKIDDFYDYHCKIVKYRNPYVIYGVPVHINQYPHSALFLNNGSTCGGVVIHTFAILTAAHCFDVNKDITHMKVVAGVTYSYQIFQDKHRYNVSQAAVHPEFAKASSFDSDIALVFVIGPIRLGPNVKKAYFLKDTKFKKALPTSPEFIITGWGYLTPNGPLSDRLMMTRLNLLPQERCKDMHNITINANMFCLHSSYTTSACYGDSGGGVIWKGQLVGIISHVDGTKDCAAPRNPGVNTHVFNYRSWIKETIDQFIKSCRTEQ